MARCDALEKLRAERDAKRLAVHSAAVRELLNVADTDGHIQAREFLGQHFGELYAVKENVTELRRAIMQLAVMGKLVPQDPNDPPASELLKQIESEKKRLVKEGKIKAPKQQTPLPQSQGLYLLPSGWVWTRLNDVLDVRDGTHDTPKYVEVGYPLVTSKNIFSGTLNLNDALYISEEDHRKISERSRVDRGDILFAMIGSIGNPVIVDCDDEFSIKNMALFKFYQQGKLDNKYLHYYLVHAQQEMKARSSGAVQSFVSLGFLRNYLFPMPSLQEQRRIVAKIDQLMLLCDTLEQQIGAARETQSAMLNTMIAQYRGQRCA
jgi:type I restriction enzyme S subunit